MTLRPLFAILIAVAMLFAPLALRSGAAMAMAPTSHHAQMTDKGHCESPPDESQPGKSDADKSTGKPCCVAMCTAVAIAPFSLVEPHEYAQAVERPATEQFGRSFLAELPTPPPRLA